MRTSDPLSGHSTGDPFPTTRPEFGMQKVFVTVAVGLVLNLPSTILGQSTKPLVDPGNLIELRIGGAVRNGGLFDVDRTLTISEALAMAGSPTPQAQGDKVWVFRDGEIIMTILGGTTVIADSPIRSGDQLFVAWQSAVPQGSWISRNVGLVGTLLAAATVAIVVAFGVN